MDWLALIASGLCEIIGVAGFNQFARHARIRGVVLVIAGFGASLGMLSIAMQTISLGVAYAVFTGIGTVGSTIFGIIYWREPKSKVRLMSVGLIVISIIGLHVVSTS